MKSPDELAHIYRHDLRLTVERYERERRRTIWIPVQVAAVILTGVFLGVFAQSNETIAFATVVAAILGCVALVVWTQRAYRGFKLSFKQEVIGRLLRELQPDLTYDPRACVARSSVDDSGFFTHRKVTGWSGEDLVRGPIGGLDIAFSELHLVRSGGGRDNSAIQVFRGLFLTAALPTPCRGHTLVVPDLHAHLRQVMGGSVLAGMIGTLLEKLMPTLHGERQRTGDPDFDAKFLVHTDAAAETATLLNADLRARLLELHARALPAQQQSTPQPGMVYFACRGPQVFVAVSLQHSLFDISLFKTLKSYDPVKRFVDDFQLVLRVVEAVHAAVDPLPPAAGDAQGLG